jgi:hypothetical protein
VAIEADGEGRQLRREIEGPQSPKVNSLILRWTSLNHQFSRI